MQPVYFRYLALAGWVALLAIGRLSASAQAIGTRFLGINYWYSTPSSPGGSQPGAPLTDDLRKASLGWLRIGGHKYDTDAAWKNPATYAAGVRYARSIGAEPIVQIPIKLTPAQLSAFVKYFADNNLTITYWAIGNEPDPSDDSTTSYNETTDWRTDVRPNEFGYTYSTWVTQYVALATQLKTDRPNDLLVGPDFRLFYDTVINDYYRRFLNDVGARYQGSKPLLDYFCWHFYGDQPESELRRRVGLVAQLLANVNGNGRKNNGAAAPIRMALTEVNAFTKSAAGDLKPWDFGAGQLVATTAKLLMQQSGLGVVPWSIYESSADHGSFDQSLYNSEGSGSVAPARRSTMWHLALLSNYRQANLMNGTQSGEADHVVVLGMRGPAGYTVLLMNTQQATSYDYVASLDNVQRGPASAVRIALEGYSGSTRQLAGTLAPQSTHLYYLDSSGNVLARLEYAAGDAAPRQQLAFRFFNRSTSGYAKPLNGAATANVTQYLGSDLTLPSLRWVLRPATPGYVFVVNQSTGNALRPLDPIAQENQTIGQTALDAGSLSQYYLQWRVEYTGSGGFYRLRNKASGFYLRPLNGSTQPNQVLSQYRDDATLYSEHWRFDEQPLDAPTAARPLTAPASPAASLAGFAAYPNPAYEALTIALPAETGQATLYDLAGRCCLRQPLGPTGQLDLRALAPGVYVLTVRTPAGEWRQRVVKE